MLKIMGKVVSCGEKKTKSDKVYYWARVLVMQVDDVMIYFIRCWDKAFKVNENLEEFVQVKPYVSKGGQAGVEFTVRRKK